MNIKEEGKIDKVHNHPIVERPERWREKGCDCVGCLREDELFNYIEHIERVNANLRESARILKEMEAEHHA